MILICKEELAFRMRVPGILPLRVAPLSLQVPPSLADARLQKSFCENLKTKPLRRLSLVSFFMKTLRGHTYERFTAFSNKSKILGSKNLRALRGAQIQKHKPEIFKSQRHLGAFGH